MPIVQEFNLDLFPGRKPPVVHVSQNDHGRQRPVRAYLFLNGEEYDPPGGCSATVEGSDKLGRGFDAVSCVVGENWVQFELTEAMTGDAGPIRCKIELSLGGTLIGTGTFILERDAACVTEETILNDENFLEKLAAAVGVYLDGDSSMIDAAVADWLDEHPEATTTVEDGSITYDKLYNGEEVEDAVNMAETLQRKVAGMTVSARRTYIINKRIRNGWLYAPWIGSAAMYDFGIANDLNDLADSRLSKRLVVVRYLAPPAEGSEGDSGGTDPDGEDGEDQSSSGGIPSGGDEVEPGDTVPVYQYTQNTPCNALLPDGEKVTTWRRGICISFVAGVYGTQIAFPSGAVSVCRRRMIAVTDPNTGETTGVWQSWTRSPTYSEYKALADRVTALEGS